MSIKAQMLKAFRGYKPDDAHDKSIELETVDTTASPINYQVREESGNATSIETHHIQTDIPKLSDMTRKERLLSYEDMGQEPIFGNALGLHLANALSLNSQTGKAVSIEAKEPGYAKMAAELNTELGEFIDGNISFQG